MVLVINHHDNANVIPTRSGADAQLWEDLGESCVALVAVSHELACCVLHCRPLRLDLLGAAEVDSAIGWVPFQFHLSGINVDVLTAARSEGRRR